MPSSSIKLDYSTLPWCNLKQIQMVRFKLGFQWFFFLCWWTGIGIGFHSLALKKRFWFLSWQGHLLLLPRCLLSFIFHISGLPLNCEMGFSVLSVVPSTNPGCELKCTVEGHSKTEHCRTWSLKGRRTAYGFKMTGSCLKGRCPK